MATSVLDHVTQQLSTGYRELVGRVARNEDLNDVDIRQTFAAAGKSPADFERDVAKVQQRLAWVAAIERADELRPKLSEARKRIDDLQERLHKAEGQLAEETSRRGAGYTGAAHTARHDLAGELLRAKSVHQSILDSATWSGQDGRLIQTAAKELVERQRAIAGEIAACDETIGRARGHSQSRFVVHPETKVRSRELFEKMESQRAKMKRFNPARLAAPDWAVESFVKWHVERKKWNAEAESATQRQEDLRRREGVLIRLMAMPENAELGAGIKPVGFDSLNGDVDD